MITANKNELLVSFPDLHEDASLRIFFVAEHSVDQMIPFDLAPDQPLRLRKRGRFTVRFRPKSNCVPFAIRLAVDGRNVITGGHEDHLVRAPQNYVASPPQGSVDGFLVDGVTLAFYADSEPASPGRRLHLTINPVKREVTDDWNAKRRRSGYFSTPFSGLTIAHGGARGCEPIYEDMCAIGDWDQTRAETFSISLVPQR